MPSAMNKGRVKLKEKYTKRKIKKKCTMHLQKLK